MIVLLDNGPSNDLTECESELGLAVGQLLTPLTRYTNRAVNEGRPWAMDNGAFAGFRSRDFLALLRRELPNAGSCLFVAAPDVVGCHDRTLDLFSVWSRRLKEWPVAFVAQDGCTPEAIPQGASAVFVGGSTEFKTSDVALEIGQAAKERELWLHVGRVNDPQRFRRWEGLADSIDGTGLSRFTHMRRALAAPTLFDRGAE